MLSLSREVPSAYSSFTPYLREPSMDGNQKATFRKTFINRIFGNIYPHSNCKSDEDTYGRRLWINIEFLKAENKLSSSSIHIRFNWENIFIAFSKI